jgi:pantoate--beta-alanine ligase
MGTTNNVTSQMRVITNTGEMIHACHEVNSPLGLVPTMGALHAGHLSLVDRARADNSTLAVSIFINPAQFGPGEDLSRYPRDLDADLDLLKQHGVDLVYVPDVSEVYPDGFETWVDVGPVADKLEGLERPGHFRGVATVVSKLFNITRPGRAYFGQKDGQQTVVVRKLARDLDMGVEIVVCPTVREGDGLAMSSRNVRLDPEQRRAAATVFWALSQARELWGGGNVDADRLRAAVRDSLETQPLFQPIDYVSVADAETLEELGTVAGPTMVSTAVRLGNVRIIDNVIIG